MIELRAAAYAHSVRPRGRDIPVRQVLSTTDRSLAESLRISLELEGIEAVASSQADAALPFIPTAVAVLHDTDYDRAIAILRGLQTTPRRAWNGVALSPRLLRALLLVLLVILAVVCIDSLGH
jgi:hypothetical protein